MRSDDGPEFTAAVFPKQLTKVGTKPIRISSSSLWENGYNERFNGTPRREVLDTEWFVTTKQAQTAINVWLQSHPASPSSEHEATSARNSIEKWYINWGLDKVAANQAALTLLGAAVLKW